MKTTLFINLWGGPGSGKSTLAAGLFYEFKRNGHDVELITETAKDWAWEKRPITIYNQIELAASQMTKEARLLHQVKYVITDSPSLLSGFYSQYYFNSDLMLNSLLQFNKVKDNQLNLLLPDYTHSYNSEGRFESKEQALNIHNLLSKFLDSHNIEYHKLQVKDLDKVFYYCTYWNKSDKINFNQGDL